MSKSNFGPEGLDLEGGNRNLTYLYGMSDFWAVMFEDSDKIELLLEANSVAMSDVYSKFLQLTSVLSIANIERVTNQQIKLYILSEADAVAGKVNTYSLTPTTLGSRFIANRPFLPTTLLTAEVEYHISEAGDELTFYKPVSSLGFPVRLDSNGVREYSFWLVDAAVDEELIFHHYGSLLQVTPEVSTENFKNFVYGLYYVYTNGPTLALLSKGLNLVLGIPLARESETVIEIRKYLNTDQFLVITDLNQYLVPYGLAPSVAVGDVLEATQEIAEWVEIKDWTKDGDWWINLQIPPAVMPYIPPGEPDRYAKAGTYADYLMRNFLKKHVFLINVKTIDFKNLQTFEKLSALIADAKPTYTYPIYIWTVPTGSETMFIDDGDMELRWDQFKCENLSAPIAKMNRINANWASFGTDHSNRITVQGNTLTYITPTSDGAARADTSLPVDIDTFFEVTIGTTASATNVDIFIGMGTSTALLATAVGNEVVSWSYYTNGSGASFKFHNAVSSSYGTAFTSGDVIGVYYRPAVASGTLIFYKNGVSLGTAYTSVGGTLYPMISFFNNGNTTVDVNFGERMWAYAPPATIEHGLVNSYITPLTRGCPQFTRYNVIPKIADLLAANPGINGLPNVYEGNVINGFVNYIANFRANTPFESAWMRCFLFHDQDTMRITRSLVDTSRSLVAWDSSGVSVRTNTFSRIVPLYLTTQADLVTKFATVGNVPPGLDTWQFSLFGTSGEDSGINVVGINNDAVTNYYDIMLANYYNFFFRSNDVNYLGNFVPLEGYKSYAPDITQLRDGDYLLFIRVQESTVGVYWITSNEDYFILPFWQATSTEGLTLSIVNAPLSRGLGPYSPYYFLRGDGVQFIPGQSSGINGVGINADLGSTGLNAITVYTDIYNPIPIPIDRSGKTINIQRDTV